MRLFGGTNKRLEILEMIQNEARVNRKLCSLGGHENIVEVFRQGEVRDCGMFYVDMELCDGNLEHFIEESYANDRSIDLRLVWNIAMEIVSGVAFIHKHGEVHRDLKPRNSMALLTAPKLMLLVLFSQEKNRWKIADFGLTCEGTSKHLRTTTAARGTAGYRAPELLRDERAGYNNKVDIWSIGCILYELASGRKLFDSDWRVHEYYRSKEQLFFGDLDSTVLATVDKTLSKDPSLRINALALRMRLQDNILDVEKRTNYPSVTSYELLIPALSQRILGATIFAASSQSSVCAVAVNPMYMGWHKSSNRFGAFINVVDVIHGTVQPIIRQMEKIGALAVGCNSMGMTLLAASDKATYEIALWNAQTGTELNGSREHRVGMQPSALAFNHSGNYLAWGCTNGAIHLCSLSSLGLGLETPFCLIGSQSGLCLEDAVVLLGYLDDDTRLCSVSLQGYVKVVNTVDGTTLYKLNIEPEHPAYYSFAGFHPTKPEFLISAINGFYVSKAETDGAELQHIRIRDLRCWAMSSCGNWIAVGKDNLVITMRVQKKEQGRLLLDQERSYEIPAQYLWFVGGKCFALVRDRIWIINFARCQRSRS